MERPVKNYHAACSDAFEKLWKRVKKSCMKKHASRWLPGA